MRIAALGAGRMGRGIGHVFAYAGYRVDIIDFKPRAHDLRDAVLAEISGNLGLLGGLGLLNEKQQAAVLARIRVVPVEEAPEALAAADSRVSPRRGRPSAMRSRAPARICARTRSSLPPPRRCSPIRSRSWSPIRSVS